MITAERESFSPYRIAGARHFMASRKQHASRPREMKATIMGRHYAFPACRRRDIVYLLWFLGSRL